MKVEQLTTTVSHLRGRSCQSRRVIGAALSTLLLGCGGLQGLSANAVAQTAATPRPHSIGDTPAADAGQPSAGMNALDAQLMYELIVAEMAGRRGQLDVATEGYLRAASHSDDRRVARRAAQLALFANRWEDAEKAARRWLELDPEAVAVHELLGQALLQQSRIEESAQSFGQLVERSQSPADDVLSKVVNVLMQQPSADAVSVLQALRTPYPEVAALPLGIARLELQQERGKAALEAVDAALRLDADDPDARLLRARILVREGRVDEALQGTTEALARTPDSIPLRLGYARLLVEAGRYRQARPEIEKLFANADSQPSVLLTIGLLAFDARRLDDARRYLDGLLKTGEFDDQAHYYLGQIADEKQDLDAAIGHYESVMPGELYLNAQVRAAELQAMSGKLPAALNRLRELSSQVADDPAIQPRLLSAEARMLQNGGRPDEAVDVLTNGLESFPDNSDLLYGRALAAEAAGDPALMEADLLKLIEADPDNAHALNALGYHLANRNERLDEAETYLEKAISLLPDDAAILDSLGWLRYRQGRLKQALSLLRKAYERFPDAEIAAHLGEVLWMNGNEEAARELWDKALVAAPDDDLLKRVVKRFTE